MNEILIDIEESKYKAALKRWHPHFANPENNQRSILILERPQTIPMIIHSFRPKVNLIRMFN